MTAAGLGEFDQNAPRAGRMYECDERATGSESGCFIYQPNAARFENVELCVDVSDLYAQVVNACAAFGDEPANGRIRSRGFEQFDVALAQGQHCYAHALVFDDFDCFEREA